jgi:Protein of unknown function (DUF3606)
MGTAPTILYFFAETEEMISGEVTPPGVFLQAIEVLRRQLFAFCMDDWVTRSSHTSHRRRSCGGPKPRACRDRSRGKGAKHTKLLEPNGTLRAFLRHRSGDLMMADDLKNRGAQDRARVNVNEDHEVRYWTQKWGASKEQLTTAVNKVAANAVARELGKA